jgi:RimJ/RimL family protein N-acetyltransferase
MVSAGDLQEGRWRARGRLRHSFHRRNGSVDPRNVPSLALLRRVGLREEAHFRKSIRSENGWDDDLIFAILDEEWRQETE